MSLAGSTDAACVQSVTESCHTDTCRTVSPARATMTIAAAPVTAFPTGDDSFPLRAACRDHATPAPPRIAHGAHERYVYRSAAICAPLWRIPTTGARRTRDAAHAIRPAGHRRYARIA